MCGLVTGSQEGTNQQEKNKQKQNGIYVALIG